jgi:hypothetical protein
VGKAVAFLLEVLIATAIFGLYKGYSMLFFNKVEVGIVDIILSLFVYACVYCMCHTWAIIQWLRGNASGLCMLLKKQTFKCITNQNVTVNAFDSQAGDFMNLVSPRAYMHAVVTLGTQQIHLFNTHLNALGSAKQRNLQISQLRVKLASTSLSKGFSHRPLCILGGDFNCPGNTPALKVCDVYL